MPNPLRTVAEVAAELLVCQKTVRRLVKKHQVPVLLIGRVQCKGQLRRSRRISRHAVSLKRKNAPSGDRGGRFCFGSVTCRSSPAGSSPATTKASRRRII